MSTIPQSVTTVPPRGNLAGFTTNLRYDLLSGFLVFLVALPLCLGISLASGYPPLAGIFTAIVGSLLAPLLSNSELTIKGPAAGLIVIVVGCVTDFGGDGMNGGFSAIDAQAYQSALAVAAVAAVLQIAFASFRAGILGEFFPTAAVHGMLAAIGVIIMIKQFPVALGVAAKGEPLEMLRQFPQYVLEANPAIATIGLVSLAIMIAWPWLKKRVPLLGLLPSQLVVLIVAVAMGAGFDLLHPHSYTLSNHKYQLGEQYLIAMPKQMFGMFDEIAFPHFPALLQLKAWKWVFMFFAIGSLESLLSAKAVDLLDPWKRKSNMDRDMLAVGCGNLAAACIGGLPMISEIVRSKANIDNGARTRFANMWHGVFLLLCVALIPMVLHRIPLAALAAMLVYTGFRLAHPNEFVNAYRIGKEQLAIFATTLVAVLATDLLVGVAIGIALKLTIHLANGLSIKSIFKPYLEVEEIDDQTSLIVARQSAVFSNWIPFRRQIEEIGLVQHRNIIVDLSSAHLVDSSVMEKLEQMQRDFEQDGLKLELRGLDHLEPVAGTHTHSARRSTLTTVRRLTIYAAEKHEAALLTLIEDSGASGYTISPARGSGRTGLRKRTSTHKALLRIEVIAPREICDKMIARLRIDFLPYHHITLCLDHVDVLRLNGFVGDGPTQLSDAVPAELAAARH